LSHGSDAGAGEGQASSELITGWDAQYDFVGNDGKAFAVLTGPSRFDGGVERQQVGLLGDVVDRLDHRADLLAERAQLTDLARCLADDNLDLVHGRGCLANGLATQFGGGAGLLATDALMLGIDPAVQRDRMAEGLEILLRLFRGESVTATSEWFTLDGYLNIDSGTGKPRGASVFGPADAAAQVQEAMSFFKDWGFYHVNPTLGRATGGTDSTSFNAAGLPGIGSAQDPIEYQSDTWHTNLDTYERIVPEDVMHNAVLSAAVMLGLGRALGEAIAVASVIGAGNVIHGNVFNTGNTLAARIALEITYVTSNLQTASLFYLALILLAIGVLTNLIARAIASRFDVHRSFV